MKKCKLRKKINRHLHIKTRSSTSRTGLSPLCEKVLKKRGRECWFCGERVKNSEMSIEHLIPKSAGGGNGIRNLYIAHIKCNNMAGSMTLQQKYNLRHRLRGESKCE